MPLAMASAGVRVMPLALVVARWPRLSIAAQR
jgi:hypothetical protein